MTFYTVEHTTEFYYTTPVRESVMEVRMYPCDGGRQRNVRFDLGTAPKSTIMFYDDYLGNRVHHFNIPGEHRQLIISAESLVEIKSAPDLPDKLSVEAWAVLEKLAEERGGWDELRPSKFAAETPLLAELRAELEVKKRDDPLSLLREINEQVYHTFAYVPSSTRADSPIDDALRSRQGVCQDFAHIMITLIRGLGIPCRYVSGYLFHRENQDRSAQDATHAWVEAWLPELEWIGLDPTNNLIVNDRHIRVAVGRDYADVPPTHGVYRGSASSELRVAVAVRRAQAPKTQTGEAPRTGWTPPDPLTQQQQQQQQQ